jgi:hypothetical protein
MPGLFVAYLLLDILAAKGRAPTLWVVFRGAN